MMSSHGLCCERCHATTPVSPPSDRGPDPPRLPDLPAPRREGPLARPLAAGPDRLPPQPRPGAPARPPAGGGRPRAAGAAARRGRRAGRGAGAPPPRRGGRPPGGRPRRWAALARAVARRPPDGGLWTGPKVARYVADRWGVRARPETG